MVNHEREFRAYIFAAPPHSLSHVVKLSGHELITRITYIVCGYDVRVERNYREMCVREMVCDVRKNGFLQLSGNESNNNAAFEMSQFSGILLFGRQTVLFQSIVSNSLRAKSKQLVF